eukprot:262572_1
MTFVREWSPLELSDMLLKQLMNKPCSTVIELEYIRIERFLLHYPGPEGNSQKTTATNAILFLVSNRQSIIEQYGVRNYLLMKARLHYVLSNYYESLLINSLTTNNYINKKATVLMHIKNFSESLNGFLNPKCKFTTTYGHFIIMLIHTFYQIEVAKNGIHPDSDIVLKLIKIGKLSVLGHKRLLDNDPFNRNNYDSRSNMHIKFGKYCLTMNKYYNRFDKNSEYILNTGIKYLKYGMKLRKKYINSYAMNNIDNYYKLGSAYLCANKPDKVRNILIKGFKILNMNSNHKDYYQRKEEMKFVENGLKMYTNYGNKYGYKKALNGKKEQWNDSLLRNSETLYGCKEYKRFYDKYLNNNDSLDFWSIAKNLALMQQCSVCKRKDKKLFCCKNCKSIKYCSRKCQKLDWKSHRYVCQCTR